MAKNKTVETNESVADFLRDTASEQQMLDSEKLIALFEMTTGEKAKMWGPSIIGFGSYHYKYASGHEGDAPLIGFSPRKSAISIYLYSENSGAKSLLADLGKYKMGKACIYIKKLDDINMHVLKKLAVINIEFLHTLYG